MERRTEIDLNTMENRLLSVRMSDSDRLVALTALRNGMLIVDAFAWLARAVSQLGDGLPAKPRLAR